MKYTLPSIAKALFAFVFTTLSTAAAAAGGLDMSVLSPDQWLLALGAGLTAGGGTFAIKNASTAPAVSPSEQVSTGLQQIIETQRSAQNELDKVKDVVTAAVGLIPGIGPLASQIINAAPTAYSNFSDFRLPQDR